MLELRDKTDKAITGNFLIGKSINSLQSDALTALMALGISRQQAEQSIQKISGAEPGITKLEDLIKKALKAI